MTCDFSDPLQAPEGEDLLAIGATDLLGNPLTISHDVEWPKLTHFGTTWTPEVVLEAYRHGLFPMPMDLDDGPSAIGWWSPEKRAIFYPDSINISRSLRRSLSHFQVTFDQAFDQVVAQCADPKRDHGWIDVNVQDCYGQLHQQGHAHSVEVWQAGQIVGGLYGVAIGGIFAGESMFHKVTNASKAALVHLGSWLNDGQGRIIDSQWMTPHLSSLGAQTVSRSEYVDLLASGLAISPPIVPV